MMIKRSTPEMISGSITENESAKKFLETVEQFFAKNDKSETSSTLSKLISMVYKGKGNIREYIMEMPNLASKLKTLKLELPEDLIVHLVLILREIFLKIRRQRNNLRRPLNSFAKRMDT